MGLVALDGPPGHRLAAIADVGQVNQAVRKHETLALDELHPDFAARTYDNWRLPRYLWPLLLLF